MSVLRQIFTPIVCRNDVPLDDIDVVAFDTHGTLVVTNSNGKTFEPNTEIARLFADIQSLREVIPLEEVVIISGDPKGAKEALEQAGLEDLVQSPIEDRGDFYARMESEGKKVLAVDDNIMLTFDAQAVVHASERVAEFLRSDAYQQALKL